LLVATEIDYTELDVSAGTATAELISDPSSWINRRVETIQLLSHEETRRQVSVDFTLSKDQRTRLVTKHGAVVPLSVMTKEARRNFDVRDESGSAVPVLGRESNAGLAHIAVMSAALDAMPNDVDENEFELVWAELKKVVISEPLVAGEVLGSFVGRAEAGDALRSDVWRDPLCKSLLEVMQDNYVLFAVVSKDCSERRILKYSFGEDFDFRRTGTARERLSPSVLLDRVRRPGRREFQLPCSGAWRAKSFHLEVVIPEELRIEMAFLFDFDREAFLSKPDLNRNRASLYAGQQITSAFRVDAYIVIAPERRGKATQAAITGVVVCGLIWLGWTSGLDFRNPDASVSIVLAGAALYSGVTAARGEPSLVSQIFSTSRFLLGFISLCALSASATLAMEVPSSRPTTLWLVAGLLSTVASAWLVWAAMRAPG
jgi:hypothetical protein